MTPTHAATVMALLMAAPLSACAQDGGSHEPVSALVDSGQLDRAEAMARDRNQAVLLADVLALRGRLAESDSLYAVAIEQGTDVRWATAGRAELAARSRNTAMARRLALSLTSAYERSPTSWAVREQVAVGRAYIVLGATDPRALAAAIAVLDGVRSTDRDGIDARLRAADLLLERFNAPDASELYAEVLGLVPGNARATSGMARIAAFEGKEGSMALTRAALATNPSLASARLHLARLHLEAEAYDSALAHASEALAVDSTAVGAWGTLGAVAWLRGDSTSQRDAAESARRHSAHPADFYTEVAEAAVRHRRYADAQQFALQAVRADSLSSRALGVLGLNSLRLGDMALGREYLDRAFAIDPYNIWYKNTLTLLDDVATFTVVDTGRFRFVAPADEIDLTVAYLAPLLERAFDSLAIRYAYRPAPPIRFEVYRNRGDFSVRTVGLTGLGALGVSFGPVLAMDSPRGRDPGTFNFGSTALHELAHTFTLGASDNRVPRWVSEGLSVLEERRARPGWGAGVSLPFLAAFKSGQLLPVSRITEGLVRPRHPHEIGFSYYQASLVMEMVEAERGVAGLRALLQGFRDGHAWPTVSQRVLRMTPDSLDRHFNAWLARRHASALPAVGGWDGKNVTGGAYVDAVALGRQHLASGDTVGARREIEGAAAMLPRYGGGDGAAWPLAQLRLQQGDTTGALASLADITTTSETALAPNLLEAALREARGDLPGARRAIDRAVWIDPSNGDLHRRLAELAERERDFALALRERRAILALAPADLTAARFELARVLAQAGQRDAARREVIALLEDAPSYERAQMLLLTLSDPR